MHKNGQGQTLNLAKTTLQESFPSEIAGPAMAIARMASQVLRNILRHLNVPEPLWTNILGRCGGNDPRTIIVQCWTCPEKLATQTRLDHDTGC